MFFSVIMPVYNKKEYLEKAISSVLSQEYLKELIAIDDGSTDGCSDILDNFASKYKRLIVIHQKNQGVSAARNAGIKIASGEYVCFCDADDILQFDFFKNAYDEIIKHNPDIAFFAYSSETPDGKSDFTPSPYEGVVDRKDALHYLYDYQIKTGYFGLVTNKLTKTSIIKQCSFDPTIKLAEDWDFWVKIMHIANNCYFSHTPSFTYFKELPNSSCFKAVDYPSQLFLRLRYKDLLYKYLPQLDTRQLNLNISHYVYFSIASSCLIGITEAKKTLKNIFSNGYNKKSICYDGFPLFHKFCLFLVKHNLSFAALLMIKAKQKLKGQKNV